ncbi:MAG: DUF3299 domain-containing protein [Armatimonadota bacterium]
MARSRLQQQRRRNIIWIAVTLGALLLVALGPWVKQYLTVPEGYLSQPPADKYIPLNWDVLTQGDWPQEGDPKVPQDLRTLDGKQVSVRGFILPLDDPGQSFQMFIAPKPRGCYFCFPPGVSEVVLVTTAGDKKLPLTNRPVTAYGTFRVANGSKRDRSLYTIENAVMSSKLF